MAAPGQPQDAGRAGIESLGALRSIAVTEIKQGAAQELKQPDQLVAQ